jgi:hypothetical protein
MTTKLSLYNQSLGHLKEGKLADLTEAVERRYVLDDYYDDALLFCLEQGLWNHAMRSVSIDSSTSLTPAFGYTYAFEKPSDWVRTNVTSALEGFDPPLKGREIVDEAGVWYADCDPLYVQYVSSSTDYGGDLSLWPPTYALFVSLYLAFRASPRIATSDTLTDALERKSTLAKRKAQSMDAMNQPVAFPPAGSWRLARAGAFSTSRSSR